MESKQKRTWGGVYHPNIRSKSNKIMKEKNNPS